MHPAEPIVFSILLQRSHMAFQDILLTQTVQAVGQITSPLTWAHTIRVMTSASQGLIYLSTACKYSGSIFRNKAGISVPKSLVAAGSVTDFNRNKNRVTQNKGVIQIA